MGSVLDFVLMARRVCELVVWVSVLVATIVGLPRLGGSTLAGPSQWTWRAVYRWLLTHPPDTALVALLRVVVVCLAWYLLVTTLLSLTARAVRIASLIRIVDVVTIPTVRRLAAGAVGFTVVAAPVLTPQWAMAADPIPANPTPSAVTSPSIGAASGPPVMRLIAAGDTAPPTMSTGGPATTASPTPPTTRPSPTPAPEPAPAAGPAPAGPDPAPSSAGHGAAPAALQPLASTWIVEPGDHLWRIATRTLARTWDREPSAAQVGPFWVQLVRLNPQLRNPNLIYADETVFVPPPPAPPP